MCAREPRRDVVHAEGMLAHAPHRHNSDARIGDEHLIRGEQLIEREIALLARRMPSAAHSRSTIAAHDARDAAAVDARCHQAPAAHDEHIAHGAADHVVARRRAAGIRSRLGCAGLGGRQHVLEPVEMFDAGERRVVGQRAMLRDAERHAATARAVAGAATASARAAARLVPRGA